MNATTASGESPPLGMPDVTLDDVRLVAPVALGAALLSFSDTIVTGRAFASRNRYRLDANRELLALGIGNLAAAFTQALSRNTDGFTTLLAVVTPNLPCKPDTVLFNKVTIKGAKQAVQMFGPAQAAVARAVMDSVSEGVISKTQANDLCILVGVFIHWQAEDPP